jgi:hypothetical protein
MTMKNSITNSLSACILCCLLSGCHFGVNIVDGYSFDYTGTKRDKVESGNLAAGINEIRVENRFGDLVIESAADGETGWTWDASCWASSDEMAKEHLDALLLSVETSGDSQSWKLDLPNKKNDLRGVRSNLKIRVPSGLQVKLVNAHGNLEVSNIDAHLTAENSHGDVSLNGLAGKSAVTLSHGHATANRVADLDLTVNHGDTTVADTTGSLAFSGSHGHLRANHIQGPLTARASHTKLEVKDVSLLAELATSHNSIIATQLRGGANVGNRHGEIEISESTGNIEAKNQHGTTRIAASSDIISVESQHGRVEINVLEPTFQSIRAETTHSDLVLSVPASSTATLDLDVSHGKQSSELQSDPRGTSKIRLKNSFGDIRVLQH